MIGVTGYVAVVVFIVERIVWGVVCNEVLKNKGYDDNWFFWGLLFGMAPAIVALSKPNGRTLIDQYGNVISYDASDKERMEKDIIRDGGWKCEKCGKTNEKTVGTCACGCTRHQ